MHDLTAKTLTLQWLAIAQPKGLRQQCNIIVLPDPSTSQGTLVCRRNLSHGILLKSINANFISSMEENTTNFFWGFHVILSLEQQSLMPTTVTTSEHLNSCKPAGKPLMYKHRYAENYGSQCVCVCPWLPLLPGNFKCEL